MPELKPEWIEAAAREIDPEAWGLRDKRGLESDTCAETLIVARAVLSAVLPMVTARPPEADAALRAVVGALGEARHWIVKSGAVHPGGIISTIDEALALARAAGMEEEE